MYWDYSFDGVNFLNLFTQTIGTYITPTQWGFGGLCSSSAAGNVWMTLLSWNTFANATL